MKQLSIMKNELSFVYILTNRTNRVLYVGVTNDLTRRMHEHKSHIVKGFTSKYNIDKLVYFEATESVLAAIEREKQIKGWSRNKKIALIEEGNPHWDDLFYTQQIGK